MKRGWTVRVIIQWILDIGERRELAEFVMQRLFWRTLRRQWTDVKSQGTAVGYGWIYEPMRRVC